jgi:hypothetical protein
MGNYGASWEAAGYAGGGSVGSLIGSLLGHPAVVCGGASGVLQEYDVVQQKYGNDLVVFAANDIGMYLPVLHHWCSLHADNLGAWKAVRWLHAREREVAVYHSVDKRAVVDHAWIGLTPVFCLSGYFAMQLAWIMGCSPIILAGCPGDATPRFFETQKRGDHFAYGSGTRGADEAVNSQIVDEMKRLPHFKAAVRSMSGWTQEFFGGL